MTDDKLNSHYRVVKARHDELDKKIEEAYNHYVSDDELHKMKVEKLHLKEEMAKIEAIKSGFHGYQAT